MLGVAAAEQAPPDQEHAAPPHRKTTVLADFNGPLTTSNMGWTFGAWQSDPTDATQFCRIQVVDQPRLGTSGSSLRLDYDVDSLNPAYNGLWVKVPGVSLDGFQTLSIGIKGDASRGFTTRVKLELKGEKRAASYVLTDVKPEWVQRSIPLSAFNGIETLKTVDEFVVVFDDIYATSKTGTIYVDDIFLEE